MRVLVADDEVVARVLLESMLRRLGHEAVSVSDGEAAWEAFRDESFQVLISDWRMPGLDGPELCFRIRERSWARYPYLILITALDKKGHYQEGMNAGADDFLSKPVDPAEVAARLRVAERVVGLSTENQQLRALLPTCPTCNKIRDENNQWMPLEKFAAKRTGAEFRQRSCPECLAGVAKPW